jgi:hypothetical protein
MHLLMIQPDLAHNGKSVHTKGKDVLQEMQDFIQHWEGGLQATGGALRVDESFWYLIGFEWKNNKWQYRSTTNMPGNILVRDSNGIVKTLQQLEPHTAIETLGIYIAMDENQQSEVLKLRKKAEEFSEHTLFPELKHGIH